MSKRNDLSDPAYRPKGFEKQFFGPWQPSRREYFAAAALQGILAESGPCADEEGVAESAVACADALIAELDK